MVDKIQPADKTLRYDVFNKMQAATAYKASAPAFGFDKDENRQWAEAAYSNQFFNTTRASRAALGFEVNSARFADKYDDIVNHTPIFDCYV